MNVHRPRLVFHGSIILLVALSCGLPSVVEVSGGGTTRMWQAAHSSLLLMAIWLYAEAAILELLVLKRLETSVLVWALVLTGYTLSFVAIVQAIIGVRALGPSKSFVEMSVFSGNLMVVLGSVLSTAVTLIGARNAFVVKRHLVVERTI